MGRRKLNVCGRERGRGRKLVSKRPFILVYWLLPRVRQGSGYDSKSGVLADWRAILGPTMSHDGFSGFSGSAKPQNSTIFDTVNRVNSTADRFP